MHQDSELNRHHSKNPGISDIKVGEALGGRNLVSGCSQVVKDFRMGPSQTTTVRSLCPHGRVDLSPFEVKFPSVISGQDLNLTSGDKLLLSACSLSVPIGRLVIPNGATLVFNDQDFTLRVREIIVETGGELLAGSEACRLLSQINIIFLGSRSNSSPAVDGAPSKGIMASGTVEIHSKQYHPTFTRLAATARINDTYIFLQDAVNWEVGQKILLTTTSWYDCPKEFASWCPPCALWEQISNRPPCKAPDYYPHQNEIRTIVAISTGASSKNLVLQIDKPLLYDHFAGDEYSGEVALLSRRFRLMGEDSGNNDNFGGHVMVHSPTGVGRFSGVHGENMGQLNTMGRYPFHLHLIGNNGSKSFIQDCLVTNSNFRAYTIHAVNNSRLSRSVAYNVKGFAVYLEDAIEENNLIEYNLMAHVHPIYRPANGDGGQGGDQETQRPELLVPADISASGYYITNAYNDIVGNVASGGWSGFAFPNAFKPLGVHKHLDYGNNNPANRPTKNFSGNTAHSTGFYWRAHGAGIYVGANIFYDPATQLMKYDSGRVARKTVFSNGTDAYMHFNDTKVYATNKGVSHWGNKIEIYGLEVHDFGYAGAMVFGQCAIVNGIINARTANKEAWQWQRILMVKEQMGFQFYDTRVQTILSKLIFRNFNTTGQKAIRYMDHSDQFIPQGINSVKGLTFENTPKANILGIKNCGPDCPNDKSETMSGKIYAIWDWDGSLVLKPGEPHILGSTRQWWNSGSNCVKDPDWKIWICAWKSNHDIIFVPLAVPGLSVGCDSKLAKNCSSHYSPYTVGYVTQFGKTKDDGISLGPWPGVAGHSSIGWYWRPQLSYGGVKIDGAPSAFNVGEYLQIRKGRFVVLAVAYPPQTKFEVKIVSTWSSQAKYPPIPMATSKEAVFTPTEDVLDQSAFNCTGAWYALCSKTGGPGLGTWFFDGKHFYLRVVSPGCYSSSQRLNCQKNFYTADGINVPSLNGGFIFSVTANCSDCNSTTYNNVKYYTVPDTVPPAFNYQLGNLRSVEKPLAKTENSVCNRKTSIQILAPSKLAAPLKSCSAKDSSVNCFHPKDSCNKQGDEAACLVWKNNRLVYEACKMC